MLVGMSDPRWFDSQWAELLACLPVGLDLERTAREAGLLTRVRAIRSATDLLRLALVYGFCGLSLRQTAAWAEAQGIASLSAQAVMKQLRHAAPWLKQLLSLAIHDRTGRSQPLDASRLILIDATCLSQPGSSGIDWRLHVDFDPVALAISHVEVTDARVGETLNRHPIAKGDLIVADTAYARRRGFWAAHEAGADFIVRLNWHNVPLQQPDGRPFDIPTALRSLGDTQIGDFTVFVADDPTEAGRRIKARLIAVRKSPDAATKARHKAVQERRRKAKQPDPRTVETAGYVFVLTSIEANRMPAVTVLETYRFRWQIELVFKRLKGLLHVDDVPAKDPALVTTFICAKLLAALLLDRLTERLRSFSPWRTTLPDGHPLPVADPASTVRRITQCHPRHSQRPHLAPSDRNQYTSLP